MSQKGYRIPSRWNSGLVVYVDPARATARPLQINVAQPRSWPQHLDHNRKRSDSCSRLGDQLPLVVVNNYIPAHAGPTGHMAQYGVSQSAHIIHLYNRLFFMLWGLVYSILEYCNTFILLNWSINIDFRVPEMPLSGRLR